MEDDRYQAPRLQPNVQAAAATLAVGAIERACWFLPGVLFMGYGAVLGGLGGLSFFLFPIGLVIAVACLLAAGANTLRQGVSLVDLLAVATVNLGALPVGLILGLWRVA